MDQAKESILEDIEHGGGRCELALKSLYDKLRPSVIKYIKQNHGSPTEAQDVLQDAIVAVYTSIVKKKFRGESTVSTFTYSVVRNLWINKLKRKKIESKYIESSEEPNKTQSIIPSYFHHEKREAIEGVFSMLGSDCKDLLVKIYYNNYSMKDIVATFSYENEQVARNKKYKCMKRLKKNRSGQ